jgi:6-phosphogluconolactonase (cycloisomerase 2 family)
MVNRQLIMEMHAAIKANESLDKFKGKPTLKLIQSIQTIPSAFPNELNTCGRICIHESGRFVIVSNRGHQSIAILKVNQNNGQLSTVGNFHTRGETPRHFKFDKSGQYLIVANQDSNNLSIFNFNQYSGEIKFTGNEYQAPSPNFICCCSLHNEDTVIMNDYDEIVVFEVDSDLEAATKKLQKRLKQAEEEVQYLKSQIAVSM